MPLQWVQLQVKNPELPLIAEPLNGDYSVLAHFENGSIETIHVKDFFGDITNGQNEYGVQLWTKWYINHNPKITHWMYLPTAPSF